VPTNTNRLIESIDKLTATVHRAATAGTVHYVDPEHVNMDDLLNAEGPGKIVRHVDPLHRIAKELTSIRVAVESIADRLGEADL
jgi:hypothetical protein